MEHTLKIDCKNLQVLQELQILQYIINKLILLGKLIIFEMSQFVIFII